METEKMIYLVTEYAAGGEIFGNLNCVYILFYFLSTIQMMPHKRCLMLPPYTRVSAKIPNL